MVFQIAAALALTLAPVQVQGEAVGTPIEREFALRALFAEVGAEGITRRAAASVLLPLGGPGWSIEFGALDAVQRAGGLAHEGWRSERREVLAPALATLAQPDPNALADRLVVALDSPFSSERSAALDRLARALLEEPSMRGLLAMRLLSLQKAPRAGDALEEFLIRAGSHGGFAAALVHLRSLRTQEPGASLRDVAFDWLRAPIDGDASLSVVWDPTFEAVLELVGAARGEPGARVDRVAWSALAPGFDESDLELISLAAEEIQGRAAAGTLAAREEIEGLGEALLGTAAWESGLRMVSPARGLARLLELPVEDRVEGLDAVDSTRAPFPAEALLGCVAEGDVDLAMTALYVAGRRFAYGAEEALLPVVQRALDVDDEDLVQRAFDWISSRGPAGDAVLLKAWRARVGEGQPSRLQLELLRRLTRDRPTPAFRDTLLLLLRSDDPDPSVIELCGLFEGDDEVREALLAVYWRAIEGVEAADGYLERLLHDGVAAQVAVALGRIGGDREGPLAEGLVRAMELLHGDAARGDARPKFPKRAVMEIARVAPERVARFLGADVPRRVRVEAALQILGSERDGLRETTKAAAAERLVADFAGVDGTLRLRALRALGRAPAGRSIEGLDALLRRLVAQKVSPEARAAVGLAARRKAWELLDPSLVAAIDAPVADEAVFELAREVAMRRADAGGEDLALALGLLGRCDGAIRHSEGGDALDALIALRGALLETCARGLVADARGGAADEAAVERVLLALLRRPLAAARFDLAARLAGEDRLKVEFRWAPELGAFDTLAGAGLGARLLEATPRWSRIDPRLLVALGRRAGTGAVAVQLLEAGLFGLGGERRSRTWERARASAWLALAEALPEEDRWRPAQGLCRDLWTGRVREQVVGALEGERAGGGPVAVRAVLAALEGRPGFEAERAAWGRALPE